MSCLSCSDPIPCRVPCARAQVPPSVPSATAARQARRGRRSGSPGRAPGRGSSAGAKKELAWRARLFWAWRWRWVWRRLGGWGSRAMTWDRAVCMEHVREASGKQQVGRKERGRGRRAALEEERDTRQARNTRETAIRTRSHSRQAGARATAYPASCCCCLYRRVPRGRPGCQMPATRLLATHSNLAQSGEPGQLEARLGTCLVHLVTRRRGSGSEYTVEDTGQ